MGNLRRQSAVTRESVVLQQCLGWVFVYFDVMVHGCARASACRAREALEVKVARPALHIPPIFGNDGTTPNGIDPEAWQAFKQVCSNCVLINRSNFGLILF